MNLTKFKAWKEFTKIKFYKASIKNKINHYLPVFYIPKYQAKNIEDRKTSCYCYYSLLKFSIYIRVICAELH